jgi:hypothetical protein
MEQNLGNPQCRQALDIGHFPKTLGGQIRPLLMTSDAIWESMAVAARVGRQNSFSDVGVAWSGQIMGLGAVLLPTKRIMPFFRDPATLQYPDVE